MDAASHFLDRLLGLSATSANDLTTVQVCLRAFAVYVALIVFVRLGKKRFLGEATAFDAILIIMIGSLSSRAISGTAPFFVTLAGTFVLIVAHWLISYFSRNSPTLSALVKGHDTILIKNGHVNRKGLRDAHMSSDDLAEDLREQGMADCENVREARLERSGRLSVVKK